MLANSDFSSEVWLELLDMTVYLRLWISNKHLKEKTFYETLTNKKSDFSNLQTVKCLTWALISDEKWSKLNFKVSKCRLLDYAVFIQYILYEIYSDQIIYFWNVVFDESAQKSWKKLLTQQEFELLFIQ